jgi:uncharacterized membrane protein YhiD involved in acid resistance
MAEYQFAIRLIVALVLGALVGAEPQWRQRAAGLRTNCLVAMSSGMFGMMGGLMGGTDGSQRRVAAYVVSGIGFLGGVILKDGFSIHGLNTAATLWCTAAVGTRAGLGYTTPECICRTSDGVQIRALHYRHRTNASFSLRASERRRGRNEPSQSQSAREINRKER